jgi:hypothetical protein
MALYQNKNLLPRDRKVKTGALAYKLLKFHFNFRKNGVYYDFVGCSFPARQRRNRR